MLHTRGLRLHAATAGDPANPLILLIHGTFGAWIDYRDILQPLADEGFYAAALDMRGYGMSDKPPTRPGSDALYAIGDIDGVITALGHPEAVIVGHDTGGSMAWAFAAAYPERTRALVSVSAAHPLDLRRFMRTRPWQLMPMLLRIGVGNLPIPVLERFAWAIPKIWRAELALNTDPAFHSTDAFNELLTTRITAARISNALRGIVNNSRLLTPPLIALPSGSRSKAPVKAPVLLIHPPQQVWRNIDRLARKRANGYVEQVSVERAKNLPQVENPQGFVAAVTQFVRERTAGYQPQ